MSLEEEKIDMNDLFLFCKEELSLENIPFISRSIKETDLNFFFSDLSSYEKKELSNVCTFEIKSFEDDFDTFLSISD